MQINIQKRHTILILSSVFLLAVITYAIAAVPSPGHSASQIDFSSGISSIGKLENAPDGSGWNIAMKFTDPNHAMLYFPTGGLGFGMHKNRNFYWRDIIDKEYTMWLDHDGNLITSKSMRAPIFYDKQNTKYYVDPASTSKLNNLEVTGTCTGCGEGGGDSGGIAPGKVFWFGTKVGKLLRDGAKVPAVERDISLGASYQNRAEVFGQSRIYNGEVQAKMKVIHYKDHHNNIIATCDTGWIYANAASCITEPTSSSAKFKGKIIVNAEGGAVSTNIYTGTKWITGPKFDPVIWQ